MTVEYALEAKDMLIHDTGETKPDTIEDISLISSYKAISKDKIVAVLPAYNEEVSIGSMVLRTKEHAGRVIVIDDGNSDHTASIAEMAGAEVIRHTRIKEVETDVRYDVDCSTEHSVSHGVQVLVKILHDMEFNKLPHYFTVPGMVVGSTGLVLGLLYLRNFYLGGSLSFGPTLLMIMMTLVGTFMAFTGIILHSISRMIYDLKGSELK